MPAKAIAYPARQTLRLFFSLISLLIVLIVFRPNYALAKEEFLILLPININQADALTLSRALSGVGPKKAAAIVAFREAHGAFEDLHDLMQVKGIGPGTLAKNQGRISFE